MMCLCGSKNSWSSLLGSKDSWPSLLGTKNGWPSLLGKLSLVTTEGGLYRRPLISPPQHLRRKIADIPFERGEFNDHAYIKIFLIGYEMAVHQVKQSKTILSRRY
jgi:hypothetical protein